MTPNLPTGYLEEVRLEIIDETAYTDNEIYSFTRVVIKRVNPLVQGDATIVDSANIWDYTVSGIVQINDAAFWEVIKWGTICLMIKNYMNKMITEGIGISIGLGAERIDTKSLLLSVKGTASDADKTFKEKILTYNMLNTPGYVVDLYVRDKVW